MEKSAPEKRRITKSRPETLRKRKAILEAATAVFGQRGYASATLAEIADQVGMTHAGVLHHFGSKRNLLLETVGYRDVSDLARIGRETMPPGRAKFDHLVETAFRNAERPGIVQAFVVLSTEAITDEHPALDYFQLRYQVLRDEVSGCFRELCAAEGVTEPDTINHAAASILAVMDGLQYQWLLNPDQIDLGEASKFAIYALVDAVLPPQPPDGPGGKRPAA